MPFDPSYMLAVLALSASAALVSAEEVTINATHLAAVLGWLTMVILAMGSFIAMIFKRNLEQQDKDRAMLNESFVALKKSVDVAEAREDALVELLSKNDKQNAELLKLFAEALKQGRDGADADREERRSRRA